MGKTSACLSLIALCFLVGCGPYYMHQNYQTPKTNFFNKRAANNYSTIVGVMPYDTKEPLQVTFIQGSIIRTVNYQDLKNDLTMKTVRAFQESELFTNAVLIPEKPLIYLENKKARIKSVIERYRLDLLYEGELKQLFRKIGGKEQLYNFTIQYSLYNKGGEALLTEEVTQMLDLSADSSSGNKGEKESRHTEDRCLVKIIDILGNSQSLLDFDKKTRPVGIISKDALLITSTELQKPAKLLIDFTGDAQVGWVGGQVFKDYYRYTSVIPIKIFVDDNMIHEAMIPSSGHEKITDKREIIHSFKYQHEFPLAPGISRIKVVFYDNYWMFKQCMENNRSAMCPRGVQSYDQMPNYMTGGVDLGKTVLISPGASNTLRVSHFGGYYSAREENYKSNIFLPRSLTKYDFQ